MSTSISSVYKLNDGYEIPTFGLGCWAMDDTEAYHSVLYAFKVGYRLIDTAARYGNEAAIGKALKDSGLDRKSYYIVTKLPHVMHGYNNTKIAFHQSLKKLQLDYVDLYLLHSPRTGKNIETWKAMIELKKEGKIKSIGVSNFSAEHLECFIASDLEVPAVNQIEIHPLNRQTETVEYCNNRNIIIMNFCPLIRGRYFTPGAVPLFDRLESKLKKTKAQLFLRWAIQSGFVTIPKSSNYKRIKENADIFDWKIDKEDMTSIGQLRSDVICSSFATGILSVPWSCLEETS